MRIAHVITLFRPDFVGGATLVCERVARGLAARGHAVAVFCGRPDPAAAPYATTTWDVAGVPVTGVHVAPGYAQLDPRSYRHPEAAPAFAAFLAHARPDVVHVHSIQALGAELLGVAAAQAPVVVTMHDWWWYCVRLFLVDPAGFVCPPRVDPGRCHCAPGVDFGARRAFLDGMLGHARRVLAPSRFLADAIIANGVPRARVAVAPNGVDPIAMPPRRRPGPVRFGYLGGPDNRLKGLPCLLRAAAELDAGGWEMALYGVVDRQTPVPATARDRVTLRPPFPPAELDRVLGGLDCLVVPSLMRESFSLVVREALAAGVPVVTSDSGGPQEIVRQGVNGLTFATGDAGDLARRLRRLVLEPALLDRLRAGARATPIPTVADQVTQLERVYAEVLAESKNTGVGTPADLPTSLGRRVLFLTGIEGAPFRYRVTNLRDRLRVRGIASEALFWTDPRALDAVTGADLVVLYRVPIGGYVRALVAEARRLGRPVVFSCDDLVFDRDAAPADALALLPEGQRTGWLAWVDRYAETLRACDGFLGATEPLVAAAARLGIPGAVARNGLGEAELAVAEAVRKDAWFDRGHRGPGRAAERGGGRLGQTAHGADGPVRIAYLSGTTMHDLDFAAIEPAITAVLGARPEVHLRLVGYLRTGPALAPFADRIERLPFLPWRDLFACLAEVDVNLAPLASRAAFADAKSEVKYLEAAVLGVPTIASPRSAFRHAIRHGENGLLAETREEWEACLSGLVDDPGLRRRLGNAALADAFLHYTPEAQADEFVAALARIVRGGDAAGRAAPAVSGPSTEMGRTSDGDAGARALDDARLRARFPGEVGRHDLEAEDALPGPAVTGRDTPSPFLLPGHAVGQVFRAPADGLYRIDLCVGTDARVNDHRLVVHIVDRVAPDALDLRRVTLDAATFADHAWIAAEFAPITDSAGRELYVWVEAEGAAPGNAVTLWTYTRGWGEDVPQGLHLDHVPAPGSLAFRTFVRNRSDE